MVRLPISLVAKRSRASELSTDVRGTELRDLVLLTRFYAGSDRDAQVVPSRGILRLI
jgi:hypothetical protein